MKKGNNYVVYSRDESGRIVREHRTRVLASETIKTDYPYSETLKGWPETRVFWSSAFGSAIGFAPMSEAAKRATT